jgi:hypothetical protein
MAKTTVVTMFFNLKNLVDSSSETRPVEFYIKNGVNVLKLQYPMVIFCDDTTYDILKTMRDSSVDPNIYKTMYIKKNIVEYEYYNNCWSIINNNRVANGYPGDKRNTVSYFLMGMFKPLAFAIAHKHNFFNTTHYAWIDFGCNHIVRDFSQYVNDMLDNPNPKVSSCYIHYRSKNELSNMREFMRYGGPCGMASTAYTIEASYVDKFYTSMFAIFYEKLYKMVGHTDETVMTYCYDRYPEIFDIYYGDYYSIFSNYKKPTQDIHTIVNCFIKNAANNNRLDLAKTAARKILDSNLTLDSGVNSYLNDIVK